MRQKEDIYKEAILTGAITYMDVDLINDLVLEPSQNRKAGNLIRLSTEQCKYSEIQKQIHEKVIMENKDEYAIISDRNRLVHCFEKGAHRFKVFFFAHSATGGIRLYREHFFLHKDAVSGNVHVFCVIYDLSDHHRYAQDKRTLGLGERLYIQTFGRFQILRDGEPIHITGKAKEILAIMVTKRGKEIGNIEIYHTIWEGRPYSNKNMSVYYNALRRLKKRLKEENLEKLIISTARGQMINTCMFDCDYYSLLDDQIDHRALFEGEFLSEYSWGEPILADIMENKQYP